MSWVRLNAAPPLALLVLTACSRESLIGGPGPEVAHHASPAEMERLAVAEPVKKFKTVEACKAHLEALGHEHGAAEIVQISEKEFRAYASKPWGESEIHHEYACNGKELTERSWTAKSGETEAHDMHKAAETH